ncbi:hypothetical protein [Kribbella catacumbae]|uniref:hypothetical protein n=1 Tax=Kribbella catacumbae TaxID=460086 RepID=UPI00036F61BB|nr:hypothetical protein [Kribbella catacumbae]
MVSVPDPGVVYPMAGVERVVLLGALVESELVEVGDYSYYDDPVRRPDEIGDGLQPGQRPTGQPDSRIAQLLSGSGGLQ